MRLSPFVRTVIGSAGRYHTVCATLQINPDPEREDPYARKPGLRPAPSCAEPRWSRHPVRTPGVGSDVSEATNAIACGLVYVGDQLAAANEQREVTNGYLSAIANLLETLDATLSNGLSAMEAAL